jgi:uncharacterized protein YdhG (YjbR/CyaY superfamily)
LAIDTTVRRLAPQAQERISYQMPAFFLDGPLIYFGAFKKHIGVYPPVADPELQTQCARYTGPKCNLKFPLGEPLPLALIEKIVAARLAENRARKSAQT